MIVLIMFVVCELMTVVICLGLGAYVMHRSIYRRFMEAQNAAQAALEARDQAYEVARSQAKLELESRNSELNKEVAAWTAEQERIQKERADLDEVVRKRVQKEVAPIKDFAKAQIDEATEKVKYAEQLIAGKLDPELAAICQCKHPRSMHVWQQSMGRFTQCNQIVSSFPNQSRCACRTYTTALLTRKQAKEYLK